MLINIICTIEWHGATWMCQYRQVNSWLYCTAFVLQMKTMIADDMLCKTSLAVCNSVHSQYIAVIFFSYNSWKITHSLPVRGRYNGCCSWVQIWPKFYHCNCCAVCIIASYMTVIYWEPLVQGKAISEDCYAKNVDKYRNLTEFCEMT